MTRRVVVLNHFACARGAPGGTRHVELFGRLADWDAMVIGSRLNYFTRAQSRLDDGLFHTVPVLPYSGNGSARVLNWLSYAVTAFIAGLRGSRPAVVYASSPHLLTGLSGWALARVRRAAFVLEIRDLWPIVLVDMGQMSTASPVYRALQALERFLYARADLIVVMAKGVQRVLVDEHRIPAGKIVFIPNGADPEDFDPPAERTALRERFGLSGTVFAYAGAHGPANGLDLLLDAAAAVRDKLPDVTFLLVGDGTSKAGLVSRAARESLTNVRFLSPIAKSEMPALLGAVDVGVHVLADVDLFRYGISPNKLFDYMAASLPVITNTPGEVAALVEEAGAGMAVSPAEIAQAVEEMAALPADGRHELGRKGRAYMASTRSRTELSKRLATALDSVTGPRHA